jgi:hypothetical protein
MPANLKETVDHHLPSEIAMLFGTHNRLTDGVSEIVVHHALVQAFCIQVRLLNDFLCSTGNGVHAKQVTTGYRPTKGRIDNHQNDKRAGRASRRATSKVV